MIRSFRPNTRDLFLRFRRDRSGNILMIIALLLPVVVGCVGLGLDVGLWLYKHQTMQSAADSAAISAVTGNASNMTTEAKAVTATYGFTDGSDGVVVTVNQPPITGNYTGTPGAVQVIITRPQERYFSALFSHSKFPISARAVALADGVCVLALNRTVSGAATAQGSTNLNLINCSLYDDSKDGSALTVGGSAHISALSIGVVGGISGGSNITAAQGIRTGISPVADPYASAVLPSFSGCDQKNFTAKTVVTINPGVYCGGMKVNAGAVVTLNPGIYFLDQGSLSVAGGATMIGNGVTLVFTSSTGNNWATATINGGAVMNLTAPASGPTAGIVFFGDRRMPAGTAFKFEGGASQVLTGAIYVSKGAVTFSGGSATSAVGCTQLVADTITFAGNSNFALNCQGVGTKPFGAAKLME
jgi:putative Flp pilus-assembly TadE/G-like protein